MQSDDAGFLCWLDGARKVSLSQAGTATAAECLLLRQLTKCLNYNPQLLV